MVGILTKPSCYMLLLSALTLVLDHSHGACYDDRHITICPYPAYIKLGEQQKLEIVCKLGGIGILHKLEVGRVQGNNYLVTGLKFVNESAKYRKTGKQFTPKSNNNLTSNATSLTLTLWPVDVYDLGYEWFCAVQYRNSPSGQIHSGLVQTKQMAGLPYPSDTTFAPAQAKPTYDSSEVVAMHCKGLSALIVSSTRRLRSTFQAWIVNSWITISPNDGDQTAGQIIGAQEPDGDFYRQLYILRLRISSIPGCSRRFRCFQSYGRKRFEQLAVEHVINVTVCTGSCMPPTGIETCNATDGEGQGSTSSRPDDNDPDATGRPDQGGKVTQDSGVSDDDDYNKNDYQDMDTKSSSSTNASTLIAFIFLGAAAIIALLAIIILVLRRRDKGTEGQGGIVLMETPSLVNPPQSTAHSMRSSSSMLPSSYQTSHPTDTFPEFSFTSDVSQRL